MANVKDEEDDFEMSDGEEFIDWRETTDPPEPVDEHGQSLFDEVPAPEEEYGQDADGDWVFDVVGERVDHRGGLEYEASVEWQDWSRPNGSKNTWEKSTADGGIISPQPGWTSEQRRRRHELAVESPAIAIDTGLAIHEHATFLRSQAYEEKLKRWSGRDGLKKPDLYNDLHERIEREQDDGSTGDGTHLPYSRPRTSRVTTRIKTEESRARNLSPQSKKRAIYSASIASTSTLLSAGASQRSIASSSITARSTQDIRETSPSKNTRMSQDTFVKRSSSTSSPSPFTSGKPVGRPTLSEKAKGKRRLVEDGEDGPPSPAKVLRTESPKMNQKRTQMLSLRDMQKRWTKVAKDNGAAPITIVNEFNDDLPVDPSFHYMEVGYEYSSKVIVPSTDFLAGCECASCSLVLGSGCNCQYFEGAEVLREGKKKKKKCKERNVFFYTAEGLVRFTTQGWTEIQECNSNCECTLESCSNRVSQQPRDIPIEVFHTGVQAVGWGVRSPADVPPNKVIGIYTGLVKRRDEPVKNDTYCFEIQAGVDMADFDQYNIPAYMVDSQRHGNWTRFINHSCDPNLAVYNVLHDMPPGVGLPFIVFVAKTAIPAGTQFTFDYFPSEEQAEHSEGRDVVSQSIGNLALEKMRRESQRCRCESPNCRGYFGKL